MILDSAGRLLTEEELKPMREPCERCGTTDRILTKGFGGYWKVNCRCGRTVMSGRGDAPRDGEY